ncbi:MAG: hypothetical protein ACK4UJ_11315 [Leptonema sp. (in: bacteria)]
MSKQKLFLFFLFVYTFFELDSIGRDKNIPGVDPLPMAIIDDQSLTPTTTKKENTVTDSNLSKEKTTTELSEFPRILNIKVFMDPTYPYSAKIVWDAHPQTSTPIYVVRYSKPISTKEILLNSYNLTSPPLEPFVRSFVDKDLPEGVYYYAVVTSFELSREGVLILKPGVNYTVNPFIVYRDSKKQETTSTTQPFDATSKINRNELKPSDYEILELSALNTDRGVVLNWKPPAISEIKFKIYRGREPLDSQERLQKAKLLGENTKPYFLDENPIPNEPTFYGVSTYDIVLNQEFTDLKFRSSYISHTYIKPQMEYQFADFLPDSLISYQVSSNAIQLFWVDGGSGVKFYKVYRSDEPINTESKLLNSKFLGIVQSGSIGFMDKDLPSGRYFYAVMPVISNNNELKLFYGNKTFTTYGIIIPQTSKEKEHPKQEKAQEMSKAEDSTKTNINNIKVQIEEENNVRINWDYISENSSQIKVLIYRSESLINEYEDLKRNAEYLGEFPLVAGVYVDKKLPKGNYYYSFLEFNTQTNQIVAYYYLKKPVEIREKISQEAKRRPKDIKEADKIEDEKGKEKTEKSKSEQVTQKEKQSYEVELDRISKLIFSENAFSLAESKIKELLKNKDALSKEEMGKLKFYYGIVLFKMNQKSEAKKYFTDPDVQSYDPSRANFWYKRILDEEL